MSVRILSGFVAFLAFVHLGESVGFAQPNAGNDLTNVAYPVADWVVPILANGITANRPAEQKIKTSELELMSLIHQKVAPATWDRAGGSGAMRYEPKDYLLHVRQTPVVHAELKLFLEKQMRGQVSIEWRIASFSEKAMESLDATGVRWSQNDDLKFAVLDDLKLSQLFQSAQQFPTTHIMQMPKITLFDGQDAANSVGDWLTFQTGVEVHLKDGAPVATHKSERFYVGVKNRFLPTISADRKSVSLQADMLVRNLTGTPAMVPVSVPLTEPGKPSPKDGVKMTVQKPAFTELQVAIAAKIPDQRTLAVVAGKVLSDAPNDGPPFLSKIPYISRLAARPAFNREATTVVFLLTPRIISEPEAAHVERLRTGFQAADAGKFPLIQSPSEK